MKLLVSQYVNKRTGMPGVAGQVAGYLSPNETLEATDVLYGEVVDGNYLWYKGEDGFYYWSGAFYNVNFQIDDRKLSDFSQQEQTNIMLMVLKEAESVLKKEVKNFVGCGIGNKNFRAGKGLSLIVYVGEKVAIDKLEIKVLPEIFYRGIRILTDVVETGAFVHNEFISKRDMEGDDPLCIGGGIRRGNSQAKGTRSLYVRRPNGKTFDYFLLTCYHVLLGDLFPVTKYDGDWRHASFPIGGNRTFTVVEGEYSTKYDYAAVAISESDLGLNNEETIDIRDHVPFTELGDLKGGTVEAIGYISGRNKAKVLSLFNDIPVGPHGQAFQDIILTEKISVPGDSGAPVVDTRTGRLIGFIIGGNSKYSAVLPFYNLFLNRNFEINT